MKNIYIEPQSTNKANTKELEQAMRAMYKKMLPACKGKRNTNADNDESYPYAYVFNESITIQLDVFYNVHYMFRDDKDLDTNDNLLLNIDLLKHGEKTLEEITEDVKTAIKYINANPKEEYDE